MDITGVVKRVEATKTVGANDFKMRNVIVTTEAQYPQTLNIQFVQGNVSLLDNLAEGTKVKIAVELRGREVTKEDGSLAVFNTIQGWKVEKL
jgi:translation initiation factor IF-3